MLLRLPSPSLVGSASVSKCSHREQAQLALHAYSTPSMTGQLRSLRYMYCMYNVIIVALFVYNINMSLFIIIIVIVVLEPCCTVLIIYNAIM